MCEILCYSCEYFISTYVSGSVDAYQQSPSSDLKSSRFDNRKTDSIQLISSGHKKSSKTQRRDEMHQSSERKEPNLLENIDDSFCDDDLVFQISERSEQLGAVCY